MFYIVMNSTNLILDGQNNKLKYNFPNSVNLKDKFIAVSSISMYYSWFNITIALSNNYFTYSWISGAGNTVQTFTINIPNGLYQIADLNNLIQYSCIANGTYYILGGINVYPFEFILNAPRYAVQINTYLWPTVLPVGATLPSNYPSAGVLATTTFNSIVTLPAKFNEIVGYTAGFATANNLANSYVPPVSQYVSKSSIGTLSYISTQAPNVQPNNTVIFSISGLNNPYTQPSSIIYSLNPSVGVGEQIFETPPNYAWCKFIEGTYNSLTLSLLGNDLQPLIINDPNMTFLFVIRDKDEAFLGSK